MKNLSYKPKHIWQRITRGWDDYAPYSMDMYLSKLIPELLYALEIKGNGIPGICWNIQHPDDWNSSIKEQEALDNWLGILDQISVGFEEYSKCDEILDDKETIERMNNKKKLSFDLMCEYFSNLWY